MPASSREKSAQFAEELSIGSRPIGLSIEDGGLAENSKKPRIDVVARFSCVPRNCYSNSTVTMPSRDEHHLTNRRKAGPSAIVKIRNQVRHRDIEKARRCEREQVGQEVRDDVHEQDRADRRRRRWRARRGRSAAARGSAVAGVQQHGEVAYLRRHFVRRDGEQRC